MKIAACSSDSIAADEILAVANATIELEERS